MQPAPHPGPTSRPVRASPRPWSSHVAGPPRASFPAQLASDLEGKPPHHHPPVPGSEPLRCVRIRSTTLVHLLHKLVRLPSRITGKMIISLDTITIISMLVVSFLTLCLAVYHLNVTLPSKASNPSATRRTLFWLWYRLLGLLIALLVVGEVAFM
ncbi:hypothetical protein D1007_02271 [Hordeum vulgare]|nr:hypothetical protein D1007_02271 [Hordeum vulgare]